MKKTKNKSFRSISSRISGGNKIKNKNKEKNNNKINYT